MFRSRRSYSEEDVYLVAMRWRTIEAEAEEGSSPIPGEMIEWVKIAGNRQKYFKALGIQHGFISASFRGAAADFDRFLREVLIKAHDLGPLMRFGKGIAKEHFRLREQLDPDYFEGIEIGQKQAADGKNYYMEHRKVW